MRAATIGPDRPSRRLLPRPAFASGPGRGAGTLRRGVWLLCLVPGLLAANPTIQHHPTGDPATALVRIERTWTAAADETPPRYHVELTNATDAEGGNGREQILHALVIEEALPPEAWFAVRDIRHSRGAIARQSAVLAPCRPLRLDRLRGFDPGQSQLTPTMRARIRTWSERLDAAGAWWLIGHTDQVGRAAVNQRLSEDRARAVQALWVELGAKADGIRIRGQGENAPLRPGQANAAADRRVELYPRRYPRLRWELPRLAPGERAHLSVTFRRGPEFPDRAGALAQPNPCVQPTIRHGRTRPTPAELALNTRLEQTTPGGARTAEEPLSACEPALVEVTVTNTGQRRLESVALRHQLPPGWPIEAASDHPDPAARLDRLDEGMTVTRRYRIGPWFGAAQDGTGIPRRGVITLAAQATPTAQASAELPVTIRWPRLTLGASDRTDPIYPGTSVPVEVTVDNPGDEPFYDLIVEARLPPGTEQPGGGEGPWRWRVGRLEAGATVRRTLRFRPMVNRNDPEYPIRLQAFDGAYGDTAANRCVTAERPVTRELQALARPTIRLEPAAETVLLGQETTVVAEITNPNPIDQRYRIAGRLDPTVWTVQADTFAVADDTGAWQTRPTRLAQLEDGRYRLLTEATGDPLTLTLGPRETRRVRLPLKAHGVREGTALAAVSAARVSDFDPAAVDLRIRSIEGLTEAATSIDIIVYR